MNTTVRITAGPNAGHTGQVTRIETTQYHGQLVHVTCGSRTVVARWAEVEAA